MDAREFEPDDPLPQTCQHCKWGERELFNGQPIVMCWNSIAIGEFFFSAGVGFRPVAVHVKPDHTCKHWEERE